jgi:hypothetical protein
MKDNKLSFIWANKDCTIRGNFINLVITFCILVLIINGAFDSKVADNLVKIENLFAMFFIGSFGIWRTGKYAKNKLEILNMKRNDE